VREAHDSDFYTWTGQQAALLRRRAAGEIVNDGSLDWAYLAEEIEDLGGNLRRELFRRIGVIALYLFKLLASPATDPRAGWRDTIREQRDELESLLQDNPGLRRHLPEAIARETDKARNRARLALADYGEIPKADLDRVTFDEEKLFGDWFP